MWTCMNVYVNVLKNVYINVPHDCDQERKRKREREREERDQSTTLTYLRLILKQGVTIKRLCKIYIEL